ncbi:DUF4352 domain-containing protein [Streptomyces sp. NPDC055815]
MPQPPQYGPPQTPPPGWGPPPGQPGPYGHPGPYGPPPPKKGMGAGAIVAIVLGSIVGVIILLGIIGAAMSDNTTASSDDAPTRTATTAPAPKQSAAPKEKPADDAPITLTAAPAKFTPSVLHDGGAYTSVTVTITNRGDETISTNPLYFTVTDSTGAKHAAELGMDKHQMDLLKLAKGEKATGIITVKGKITPAYVTFTEGMFGDGVRGDVK